MLPLLMILGCVLLRILPHPPNFAPVGALAVFAGRVFSPWLAVGVTLGAMFYSSAMLSALHGWPLLGCATPFVYAGFALQALLGRALRRRRGGALAAAALGSLGFFALSNLGVWVDGGYGPGLGGLAACYLAAIPFYGATLAGDLLWTVVLTQAYQRLAPRLRHLGEAWVPRES